MKKKNITPFRRSESQEEAAQRILEKAPATALITSINTQISVLAERGILIRDFDDKKKIVRKVQKIGSNIYILATPDRDDEGDVLEYMDKLDRLRKDNIKIMEINRGLQEEIKVANEKIKEYEKLTVKEE